MTAQPEPVNEEDVKDHLCAVFLREGDPKETIADALLRVARYAVAHAGALGLAPKNCGPVIALDLDADPSSVVVQNKTDRPVYVSFKRFETDAPVGASGLARAASSQSDEKFEERLAAAIYESHAPNTPPKWEILEDYHKREFRKRAVWIANELELWPSLFGKPQPDASVDDLVLRIRTLERGMDDLRLEHSSIDAALDVSHTRIEAVTTRLAALEHSTACVDELATHGHLLEALARRITALEHQLRLSDQIPFMKERLAHVDTTAERAQSLGYAALERITALETWRGKVVAS